MWHDPKNGDNPDFSLPSSLAKVEIIFQQARELECHDLRWCLRKSTKKNCAAVCLVPVAAADTTWKWEKVMIYRYACIYLSMYIKYIYISLSLYLKVCMYIISIQHWLVLERFQRFTNQSPCSSYLHFTLIYNISSSSSPQGNARSIDFWSNTDGDVYHPTN